MAIRCPQTRRRQPGRSLRRAGQGDEAAFLVLYERHRAPVFRFACRVLGSAPLAEDVTQQALLDIWRDIRRLRDPARYEGGYVRAYADVVATTEEAWRASS